MLGVVVRLRFMAFVMTMIGRVCESEREGRRQRIIIYFVSWYFCPIVLWVMFCLLRVPNKLTAMEFIRCSWSMEGDYLWFFATGHANIFLWINAPTRVKSTCCVDLSGINCFHDWRQSNFSTQKALNRPCIVVWRWCYCRKLPTIKRMWTIQFRSWDYTYNVWRMGARWKWLQKQMWVEARTCASAW